MRHGSLIYRRDKQGFHRLIDVFSFSLSTQEVDGCSNEICSWRSPQGLLIHTLEVYFLLDCDFPHWERNICCCLRNIGFYRLRTAAHIFQLETQIGLALRGRYVIMRLYSIWTMVHTFCDMRPIGVMRGQRKREGKNTNHHCYTRSTLSIVVRDEMCEMQLDRFICVRCASEVFIADWILLLIYSAASSSYCGRDGRNLKKKAIILRKINKLKNLFNL